MRSLDIARMLEHHRLNAASKMLVLTRLLVVVVHHATRHPQLFRQCALGSFGCTCSLQIKSALFFQLFLVHELPNNRLKKLVLSL
jgi:hypothetical protein